MAVDIRRALKKFLPHLRQAKAENLNEADTVQRVIRVFENVLGYSPLSEISRESNIKDKYVDIAIKIDGTIQILVEVKAAGQRSAIDISSRRSAMPPRVITAGSF